MDRLFTQEETSAHLEDCYRYSVREFGEQDCIPISRLKLYRQEGVHFYQPYGNPDADPVRVFGIVNCVLISHAELELLKQKKRSETELEPWKPTDGKAVFWVAGVVSDAPGVAAKCVAGIFDQIDAHPYKEEIDTAAMFCTGPQGYLMSIAFGMQETGIHYRAGWPFMERKFAYNEVDQIGRSLQSIWTMTKVRDVIETGKKLWGDSWRRQSIQSDED